MTVVLDSWAILALVDNEPCADQVAGVLRARKAAMSTVNLGEVAYQLIRRVGDERRGLSATDVAAGQVRRVTPDWGLVKDAAAVKARGGLSYADAFCVATAQRLDAPLWTGDPEIIALAGGTLDLVDLRNTP